MIACNYSTISRNDILRLNIDGSLEDLYEISDSSLASYSADVIFLPWIHFKPVTKYNDVFFDIFRSDTYFEGQRKRIISLLESISEHGYSPEKFPSRQSGNITGYYLKFGDVKKFYVVSGNHRSAVLSLLYPGQKVNVMFDRKDFLKARDIEGSILSERYDNIFSSEDVETWPSVRSGFLNSSTAVKILKRYVLGKE